MSLESALLAAAVRAARKALASPMRPGGWALEGGLVLEPRGKGLWHATLDPADPLRLRHLPTGRCICPAYREMDTDLASVPRIAQAAGKASKALHLAPDAFPKSAVFHDAGYAAGWFWVVADGVAREAPVTRAQADAILYLGLSCEGATFADGIAWHSGVRLGGASHWLADPAAAGWPLLFGESAAGVPAQGVAGEERGPGAGPQAEAVAPARPQREDQGGEKDGHDQDGNGGFHGTPPDSKSAPERQEQ